MTSLQSKADAAMIATSFQAHILPKVSRTFALTIPQLPGRLREVVGNAYLLCRLADTIEDDPALDAATKLHYEREFAALVRGGGSAERFAAEVTPLLSASSSPDEHVLMRNAAQVLTVTASFDEAHRAALARCLDVMCDGMQRFQQSASLAGLRDQAELDQYCYYVAGVVGELLTDLFCLHDPRIAARRPLLMSLAVSFGQGLQMTNILKDLWEDHARGACWMPRETFARHGFDLAQLKPGCSDPGFRAAYRELLGIAHAHLRNALRYTQALPREHAGIRRFCAWAVGMAVLTLQRIDERVHDAQQPFASGQDAKISRGQVMRTIFLTRIGTGWNNWLGWLFNRAASGLPLAALPAGWDDFVSPYATGETPSLPAAAPQQTTGLGAARGAA